MVDFQAVEYVSTKTIHRRIVRALRKGGTWFQHSHGVYTLVYFGTTEVVDREALAARLRVLRPWEREENYFSSLGCTTEGST